ARRGLVRRTTSAPRADGVRPAASRASGRQGSDDLQNATASLAVTPRVFGIAADLPRNERHRSTRPGVQAASCFDDGGSSRATGAGRALRLPEGGGAKKAAFRRACRGKNGRSGEIRTHDPQHPMLMRYQAALRSDPGKANIIGKPPNATGAGLTGAPA